MGSEASSQRNWRPAKEAPGNKLTLPDDSLQRASLGCKPEGGEDSRHFLKSHSPMRVALLGKAAYNSLSALSSEM